MSYGVPVFRFNLCVCLDVLRPIQPTGAMASAVNLPYQTFTGQA